MERKMKKKTERVRLTLCSVCLQKQMWNLCVSWRTLMWLRSPALHYSSVRCRVSTPSPNGSATTSPSAPVTSMNWRARASFTDSPSRRWMAKMKATTRSLSRARHRRLDSLLKVSTGFLEMVRCVVLAVREIDFLGDAVCYTCCGVTPVSPPPPTPFLNELFIATLDIYLFCLLYNLKHSQREVTVMYQFILITTFDVDWLCL